MPNYFKNEHANQRYFDRVDPEITKHEISEALKNKNNRQYFDKLTNSRSMLYLHIPNRNYIVKMVYSKTSKKIITILPWKDVYFKEIKFKHYPKTTESEIKEGQMDCVVYLYPDCFLETKTPQALTKIFIDGKEIGRGHYLFEVLFNIAWNMYLKTKEYYE